MNFLEVKFKIQDQIHCTKNLAHVIARPWFKLSSKFENSTEVGLVLAWNMTADKIEDGGLAEVCTLLSVF